ncbi:MAG: hypothetical protein NTX15_07740 [Candidatus Kapabacteria bacterium]|nr:hypothetical protein [Candidatus Kapabacteria bacterium]
MPIFSLRGLILAIIMVVVLTLLVSAEFGGINTYSTAYRARIGLYGDKLDSLNKVRSWKDRMFMRHVANIEIPTYIVNHMRPSDTVLLPPMSYGNRYMKTNAIWTDPRIFTWMVGFHTIVAWNDTARRHSANAFVVLNENQIWITRHGGATNIDSLLTEYGKGL